MGRSQGYRLTLRDTETVLRGCLPDEVYDLFDRSSGCVDGLDFMDHQLAVQKSLAVTARSVDRSTFKKVLLTGLDVRFGHALTGYRQSADGNVFADFDNGETAAVNLLVGADGINSRVRQQLLPGARIEALPMDAIVCRSWVDAATGPWLTPELTNHLGMAYGPQRRNLMFGHMLFPPDAGRSYVFWGLLTPAGELPENLKSALREWHPRVQQLIADGDPTQISRLRLRTSVPVEPWPTTNVTLLGDAIHAMSPFQGSGANTAIRDAALLATELASGLDGVARYEKAMLDYGFDAVRRSATGTAKVLAQHPV